MDITYSNESTPLLSISDVLALPDGDDEKTRRVNLDDPVESEDDGGRTGGRQEDSWEVSGTLNTGSQYHFYLEPNSALVTPTAEGGFDIVCSTQHMDTCQMVAAKLDDFLS